METQGLTLEQQRAIAITEAELRLKKQAPADPATSIGERATTAKGIVRKADDAMLTHGRSAGEMEIDEHGIPFAAAADILSADGYKEQALALKKHFPDEKVTLQSDYAGRQYVHFPDERKVYVAPRGSFGAAGKRMAEEAVARPGATVGAMIGGADAGPVGAGALGAVGGMIDEAVKKSRGLYDKTPKQTMDTLTGESMGATVGEGIARVPGRVARGAILPDWLSGATQEGRDFGRTLLKGGATPGYKSGAPSAASIQWKADLAKKLGLSESDARFQATAAEIGSFLKQHGVEDVEGTINATKGGGRVVLGDEAKIGQALAAPVRAIKSKLAKAVGASEADLATIEQYNARAKARADGRLGQVTAGLEGAQTTQGRALADAQRGERQSLREGVARGKGTLRDAQAQQKADFDKAMAVKRAAAEDQFATEMTQARAAADRSLAVLRTGQGRPATDLQATVAGDIRTARKAASASFGARYEMLDRLESGLSSSMAPVADVAKNILSSIPKGPDGKYLVAIDDALMPKLTMLEQLSKAGDHQLPVGQMAKLRTALYELGGDMNKLMPNTKQHLVRDLYKAADEAVEKAAPVEGFGKGLLTPQESTARAAKIQTVRQNIERDYAAYRRKFDDALVGRLVKDAGQRGSVDTEDVIALASRRDNQFRRVWNLLTPDTKRRVGRGLFDEMVGKSTKGGAIDAQTFYDQLTNHRGILKDVFGKDAPGIIQAARGLLAVDGKLPAEQKLMPATVREALDRATRTKKEMDTYFSKHSLALLAKGDEAQNTAVQAAKKFVNEHQTKLLETAQSHVDQTRKLVDKSAEEKAALRERIAEAGNKVGARADKRIEIGREKVSRAKEAQADFDRNAFAQMGDQNYLVDRAVDHIIQPGQEELLKKAVDLYGPGSEQMKALQQAFLRKAVASASRDLTDPQNAFAGAGIRDFLKSYTPKQRQLLLEPFSTTVESIDKAGKVTSKTLSGEEALQRVSRFLDFAFPAGGASDVSAGLAAGQMKSKMGPGMILSAKGLGALAKYGKSVLVGYLLNHPAGYKLLVQGMEYGPKGEAAVTTLDNLMRMYMQTTAAPAVAGPVRP